MSVEEKCETREGSQIRLSSSVRQRDASVQLAMNFDPRPTARCLAHPSSVRRFRSKSARHTSFGDTPLRWGAGEVKYKGVVARMRKGPSCERFGASDRTVSLFATSRRAAAVTAMQVRHVLVQCLKDMSMRL